FTEQRRDGIRHLALGSHRNDGVFRFKSVEKGLRGSEWDVFHCRPICQISRGFEMQRPALDGEQRRAIAKSLGAFHQSIAPLRITLEMPETADGLIELFGKFPVRGGARLDGLPR